MQRVHRYKKNDQIQYPLVETRLERKRKRAVDDGRYPTTDARSKYRG
jgi:hypothetical protein